MSANRRRGAVLIDRQVKGFCVSFFFTLDDDHKVQIKLFLLFLKVCVYDCVYTHTHTSMTAFIHTHTRL